MALSLSKLKRFVSTRNKADHNTNLQFQLDADACGFSANELGDAIRHDWGYSWRTPFGILKESSQGVMTIETA